MLFVFQISYAFIAGGLISSLIYHYRVSPRPSLLTTPDHQKERNKLIPSSKEEETQLGSDPGTSSSSCEELPVQIGGHKLGESMDIDDANGGVSSTSNLHGASNGDIIGQNPKADFLQDDENESIGNQQIILVSENGPSDSEDLRDVDDISTPPNEGQADNGAGSSSSSSSTMTVNDNIEAKDDNGVEYCNGGVVGSEGIASPRILLGGNHHECKI